MQNKDINYYLGLKYEFVVKQCEDGSYFLKYPDLVGCMTCAPTLNEVLEMGEDAKRVWIEVKLEDNDTIPEQKSVD